MANTCSRSFIGSNGLAMTNTTGVPDMGSLARIWQSVPVPSSCGIVLLNAVRAGERVRMSVIDRGAGIPDAFRARVQQPAAQPD